MKNTTYTSQEVIALLPNNLEQLKKTLLYLVDQCDGEVILVYDGIEAGDYSDIHIYSEFISKKDLEILFQYARNKEIGVRKGKIQVLIELEITEKGA